jgi:hypothetical protein
LRQRAIGFRSVLTCQLWDKEGLADPSVKRTADGKGRVIAPDWTASA